MVKKDIRVWFIIFFVHIHSKHRHKEKKKQQEDNFLSHFFTIFFKLILCDKKKDKFECIQRKGSAQGK